MAVNLKAPGPADLHSVAGIRLGCAAAGISKPGRDDLTIVELAPGTAVGGVFTQNRFCAAPVQLCRQRLDAPAADIRALVINTGNANAGTGETGLQHAEQVCVETARLLGINSRQILPFSTGVIMEPLPVDRVLAALPQAVDGLAAGNWLRAASAIMTTDTTPKALSRQLELNGRKVTVTGMVKGAGMIHPNMATMLGYIATDAAIAPALLAGLSQALADLSFNSITVDGDTSTNDSFIVMATGQAGNAPVQSWQDAGAARLRQVLEEVALWLAQAMVRDAEGASKFITVQVKGGRDREECRQVAFAVAHSPLVKTAFFASDPNLGRILAAVGYAGIDDLDQSRIDMSLGDVVVVQAGGRAGSYREEDGQRVMAADEITVTLDLHRGPASATVWTCDLGHEYVRINADYRS